MTSAMTCPACGSTEVSSSASIQEIAVPFSEPAVVDEVVDVCRVCGTEGDFLDRNQARVEVAVDAATRESVRRMIDGLGNQGITMAYFERAMRLPQRTLARWKGGECSSPGVALLRLVSTYPWLLEVADDSFDAIAAQQKVVEAASRVLRGMVRRQEAYGPVLAGQPVSTVSQPSAGQPISATFVQR